jgi:hypothetical protein
MKAYSLGGKEMKAYSLGGKEMKAYSRTAAVVLMYCAAACTAWAGEKKDEDRVPAHLKNRPANQWFEFNPKKNGSTHCQIAGWERAVYARCIKRVLFFGGVVMSSSEGQNALLAFSPREERWEVMDMVGGKSIHETIGPGGHDFGSCSYNPKLKAWFVKSGHAMSFGYSPVLHYDLLGNTGRAYWPFSGSYHMQIATLMSAYDTVRDRVILHGGQTHAICTTSYDMNSNRWTRIENRPERTRKGTLYMEYDSRNRVCVVWDWATRKTWIYDVAAKSWKSHATDPAPPGSGGKANMNNSVAYHPGYGLFFLVVVKDQSVWAFDAAKCKWTKTTVRKPEKGSVHPFNYSDGLVYDPDDDLFILVAAAKGSTFGAGGGYGASVWGFRYVPPDGSKPLPVPKEAPAPEWEPLKTDPNWTAAGGALSRQANGWARGPTIASHKGKVYVAWSEAHLSWDNFSGTAVYASSLEGGKWKPVEGMMPGTKRAIYYDHPRFVTDGKKLILHGDMLWRKWSKTLAGKLVAAWELDNGKAKKFVPGGVWGRRVPMTFYKGKLHALFGNKGGKSRIPLNLLAWDGGKWTQILEQPLFSVRIKNNAVMAAMAATPRRLYAAITIPYVWRYTQNGRPRFYLRVYEGKTWKDLPSPSSVKEAVITWSEMVTHGEDLYFAYLERNPVGRKPNLLRVAKWDGAKWTALGGPLNVFDTKKDDWAFSPGIALKVEGKKVTPYVSFCEHLWGQPPQVFVKHWDGGKWVSDVKEGCSLNINPARGSAQTARITIHQGKPVVAWSEHVFGKNQKRKVYVKRLK